MSKYQPVPHPPLHLYVSELLHWRKYSETKNVFYFQKTVAAAVSVPEEIEDSCGSQFLQFDWERETWRERAVTADSADTAPVIQTVVLARRGKVKTRTHATSQHIHITQNTQQTHGHKQKVSPLSWHSQSYLRQSSVSAIIVWISCPNLNKSPANLEHCCQHVRPGVTRGPADI